MRVRSLPCASVTLLSAPWSAGIFVFARPLATFGKSKAIRAGLFKVNPAGGLVSACVVLMRIATLPPGNAEKSIVSILLLKLDCSSASVKPESSIKPASKLACKNLDIHIVFFIFPP